VQLLEPTRQSMSRFIPVNDTFTFVSDERAKA